jgi:hypothetical protein
MGLKSRRPPKKGAKGGKKGPEDDDATATTASDTSSVAQGLDELRLDANGAKKETAADRLANEGIIATFSQVRSPGRSGRRNACPAAQRMRTALTLPSFVLLVRCGGVWAVTEQQGPAP